MAVGSINDAMIGYNLSNHTNNAGNAGVTVSSVNQANTSFKQRNDDAQYLVSIVGGPWGLSAPNIGYTGPYKMSDWYSVDLNAAPAGASYGAIVNSSGPLSIGDTHL